MAFRNANKECQKSIRPLKAQGASLDEWINATTDIGSAANNVTLIGLVLAKGFNSQQNNALTMGVLDIWKKEFRCLLSKGNASLQINQNMSPRIFNRCGKSRYLVN